MTSLNQTKVKIAKSFINTYFMLSSMEIIDKARKAVIDKLLMSIGRTAYRQSGKTVTTAFYYEDAFNQLYPSIDFTVNKTPKTVALIPSGVKGVFSVIAPDTLFL